MYNYIQHLKSKKTNASNPNLNPFKSCEPQGNPCLPVNLEINNNSKFCTCNSFSSLSFY